MINKSPVYGLSHVPMLGQWDEGGPSQAMFLDLTPQAGENKEEPVRMSYYKLNKDLRYHRMG
jgi:hypothetical protein